MTTSLNSTNFPTVVEAICPHCQKSLEESQNFEQGFKELFKDEKIKDLEFQIEQFKTKVISLENTDIERQKSLEDQIDIVLRMEEERLLLIKDNKTMKNNIENLNKRFSSIASNSLTNSSHLDIRIHAREEELPQISNKKDKSTNKKNIRTLTKPKPNVKGKNLALDFSTKTTDQTSPIIDEIKCFNSNNKENNDSLTKELIRENKENSKFKVYLYRKRLGI